MTRYNGNYTKDFDDNTYEPNLIKWQMMVYDAAKEFYISPLGTGSSVVLPDSICHPPNRLLCDRAVVNALTDIKRARDFHIMGETDDTKFASYIGYWLSRSKPFMLHLNSYEVEPISKNGEIQKGAFNLCFSINELFIADFMLAAVLTRDIHSDIQNANGTCLQKLEEHGHKSLQTRTMLDSLSYYLEFRSKGAQELELFLKGLLTCHVGASIEYLE